jgi:predicted ATPase/tetratricopeptide (TPR) repeat protein
VCLLGGIEARRGAHRLDRFPSRAAAQLLARLALEPARAHPREELVELLWPGVELAVGRNRLRQALSALKSLLEPPGQPGGEVLLADRVHVRARPEALVCDVHAFERAVRQRDAAAALALYRGELMPGHYEDWVQDERLRLQGLRDRLDREAPDGARAPGAASAAPPPSAVPAAPAAPPSTALTRLPAFLTQLFGAEDSSATLAAQVAAHRLVTVTGPGGSGKTRLAVEAARRLQGQTGAAGPPAFDLAVFVPLVGCTSALQVGDALTGVLGIAPGAEGAAAALARALAGRRVLLVLDNLEQAVEAAQGLVAELLERLPSLHVLATSRRVLDLDGEQLHALAPLPLPAPLTGSDADLAAAAANPAVAMFVERARAARTDFHLSARNAPTLAALVRELHGMPLAIELAASRVRTLAPAELLARLRGDAPAPLPTPHLSLLARGGPRAGHDPRHASIEHVIAWSWAQLAPGPAALLSTLTLLPAGFDLDTAAALADPALGPAALRVDEALAHSLLQRVEVTDPTGLVDVPDPAGGDAAPVRFAMLPPVREFAAARLAPEQAAAARARLRRWALDWARALPVTPPLTALRVEMPNLVAALEAALQDDCPDEAIELLLALRRCLDDVELPAAGRQVLQAAVATARDARLRARGHSLLALQMYAAGDVTAALQQAERAVAELPTSDDADPAAADRRARSLHALGLLRWRARRRGEEVEPLVDEAERLVASSTDEELHSGLATLRAMVTAGHRRDLDGAERLYMEALRRAERVGNLLLVNAGLYNLAVMAQNAGRNAVALERLGPIVEMARAQHDWRRLSQALNVRGNALAGLRRWHDAIADHRECVHLAWRSLSNYDLVFGLWNLPRSLLRAGQPAAALRIAAHAGHMWRTQFAELDAGDERYFERLRRQAALRLPRAQVAALWREGAAMPTAEVVALALHVAQDAAQDLAQDAAR